MPEKVLDAARSRAGSVRLALAGRAEPLRAALPAWLAARVAVLLALAGVVLAYGAAPHTGDLRPAAGLLVWDGAWYREIAEHGYDPYAPEDLRFFPLLPLLARVLAAVSGLPVAAALVAVCWLCALGYAVLLHELTVAETADRTVARRAVWLAQLVPGAHVLVLGYTEALGGLLAVGFFLALRRQRPGWAVALGLLSGLTRPTGVLLAAAAIVLVVRPGGRDRWASTFAVALAPLAGTATYLLWCWSAYGSPWLPYVLQTRAGLRGDVASNPLRYLFDSPTHGLPWPMSLGLLAAAGWLLWICARRLPAQYTVWAALLVVAAATAAHLHSLPRYLAAAFPLLMAAALGCRGRVAWVTTLTVSVALFGYVTWRSFTPGLVP